MHILYYCMWRVKHLSDYKLYTIVASLWMRFRMTYQRRLNVIMLIHWRNFRQASFLFSQDQEQRVPSVRAVLFARDRCTPANGEWQISNSVQPHITNQRKVRKAGVWRRNSKRGSFDEAGRKASLLIWLRGQLSQLPSPNTVGVYLKVALDCTSISYCVGEKKKKKNLWHF